MRRGIVLGVLALVAFTGVAAAGSAPHVDAGLDQDVYVGDRVYLDGGGTWDDDGDVTSKEWTIETPDGDAIQPNCSDCWFTHFRANQTGQYNATLTVRDGEGNENSDTLYVTTQGLEPEMVTSGTSDGSGGSGGCWVSHAGAGEGDNIDDNVCDSHGRATDLELNDDADSVLAVTFENDGIANEYSEFERNPEDGTLTVPMQVFNSEREELWDAERHGEHSNEGNFGEGSNSGGQNFGGGSQNSGDSGVTYGGDGPLDGGCGSLCGVYN